MRRTYRPEEAIILAGCPCEAAYFIAEGQVLVCRTSTSGREQVLARLVPGQSFNTVPPFRPNFAVRDKQGDYRGTLEVVQDVTRIRKLEGERRLLDEGNYSPAPAG